MQSSGERYAFYYGNHLDRVSFKDFFGHILFSRYVLSSSFFDLSVALSHANHVFARLVYMYVCRSVCLSVCQLSYTQNVPYFIDLRQFLLIFKNNIQMISYLLIISFQIQWKTINFVILDLLRMIPMIKKFMCHMRFYQVLFFNLGIDV